MAQQFSHARQRQASRSELLKETRMALAQLLDLSVANAAMLFSSDCLDQQVAAHADTPVDCPRSTLDSMLRESLLPRKGVRVDRVYEGAIEVKDEGFHSAQRTLEG